MLITSRLAFQLLLLNWSTSLHVQPEAETTNYDYVVIGSGIGGSTLAVELSKKNYSVLLVELGPKYKSPIVTTPVYYQKAAADANINLDYKVNFYDSRKDTDLEKFSYSRVGGLGGCSIHNVMISMLPNTADFDRMAELTNDKGWDEKSIRNKYFKSMEKNDSPNLVNKNDHGFNGWFPIAYQNLSTEFKLDSKLTQIKDVFMPSNFVDINGYSKDGELNTDYEGRALMPAAIDDIKHNRFDIINYVETHQRKYKLDVWTDTLVTKILLDNNNKATGINYSKGKYLYAPSPKFNPDNLNHIVNGTVKVNKEVIVAAGAFNSPQLLMLSGIGPKQQLDKFNIGVKVDLQGVGKNLMDKHVIPLVTSYQDDFNIFENCKFTTDITDPCYKQYIQQRKGAYTSNFNIVGQLSKSSKQLLDPDLFIATVLGSSRNLPTPDPQFNATLTSVIFKAKPKNFGNLELTSASPYHQLKINFNKFTDKPTKPNEATDLKIIMEAIRKRTVDLKKLTNATIHLPQNYLTDDKALETYIRNTMIGFHICCTSKVGKDDDADAVLDSKFKVRGTKGLRVVDASVFDRPPGYFPALFTHLVALKAADYINDEHKLN